MEVTYGKADRKTWIYGVRGTNAKIRYPPVVPWIDNTTRDAIIELFIEVSDADHATTNDEIADLEQYIAKLEEKEILTPVEHRQLHQHRKQIEALQEKLDASREQLLEDARAEALNLSLIKGVRLVRAIGESWERRLLIVTAPIKIGKALLGTYDIILDPRHRVPADAIDLIRRDRHCEHGPHPHWSSHPCFGTWGPMLSQMLKRKSCLLLFSFKIPPYIPLLHDEHHDAPPLPSTNDSHRVKVPMWAVVGFKRPPMCQTGGVTMRAEATTAMIGRGAL